MICSDEHSFVQLSQEFRLGVEFLAAGRFNFSAWRANYLHYETEENYYVFINTLTMMALYSLGGSPDFGSLTP